MKMKKLLSIVALGASLFASNNFINLKLTNNTLGIDAQVNVVQNQPIYARAGFLYYDGKSNFAYGGVKSEGPLVGVDLPFNFSLIVDFVHTSGNSAIPIGIGISSYLAAGFKMPVFFRAEAEYAPKVLSFDNADRFSKVKVETGVQFIENGEVFVGYRHLSFNKAYNSNFYGGVGFNF
jgi:hypothetical protein